MNGLEGLEENFRFLVLEVTSQLKETRAFVEEPTHAGYDKVVSRDDYIDNLKNIVEDACYSRIHSARGRHSRSTGAQEGRVSAVETSRRKCLTMRSSSE